MGSFIANETILYCRLHENIIRSQDLKLLVPFKGTYGYDVIVYIGKSLYLNSVNEITIKKEFKLKGIDISTSEIRYLGQKFIAYLAIIHDQIVFKLRLKLLNNGGYILHIDGTCEGDSPNLFCSMDEISGILLSSVKIKSEKKENIIPILEEIKIRYGAPLAVISDMSKGILGAIEEVFPNSISLICHFHFLRDIGKDLLEESYRIVRNQLKKSKIRVSLRNKAKDFEAKLGNNLKELVNNSKISESAAIKTALLIIYWIFDNSSLSGYGFPFDMNHLLFYKRVVAANEKVRQLYKIKREKPFYQLTKLLDSVSKDTVLRETCVTLEQNEIVFHEIRSALRITLPNGKNGLNDEGDCNDLSSISVKVNNFVNKYEASTNLLYKKMISQIIKYHTKLFADPIKVTHGGKTRYIQPHRTNNILEQKFRKLKRVLRKKTGNNSAKRSIKAMLPSTLLAENLKNLEYLKILLDTSSSLEERFAEVDSQLFLSEFSRLKNHNRKIPTAIKNLIKGHQVITKIEKIFYAVAN